MFFIKSRIETPTSGNLATDGVMERAPYSVSTYIAAISGQVYFSACLFDFMRYAGDRHLIYDTQLNEK